MAERGDDAEALRQELERYKNLYEHTAGEFRTMQIYSTEVNKKLTSAKAKIARLSSHNELLKDELNIRKLAGKNGKGTKKLMVKPEPGTSKALEGEGVPSSGSQLNFSHFHDPLIGTLQYFNRADLCSLSSVSRHFYRCSEDPLVLPVKSISHFVMHLSDGIAIVAGQERRLECLVGQLLHETPPSWIRFGGVYIGAISQLDARAVITPIESHLSNRIGIPWDVVTPNSAFRTGTNARNGKRDSIEFLSTIAYRCFDDCSLELAYNHSMLTSMNAMLNSFTKCRAIALIGSGMQEENGEELRLLRHPSLVNCPNLLIAVYNLRVPYQHHLLSLRRYLQQGLLAAVRANRRVPGALQQQQRLQLREVGKEPVETLKRLFEAEFELLPDSTLALREAINTMRDHCRDQIASTLSLPTIFDALEEWLMALEVTSDDVAARRELLIDQTAGLQELLTLLHDHRENCSTPRQVIVGLPSGEYPAINLLLLKILKENFDDATIPSPFVIRFPSIRYEATKHTMAPIYNAITGEVFKCCGSSQAADQTMGHFQLPSLLYAHLVVSRLPG